MGKIYDREKKNYRCIPIAEYLDILCLVSCERVIMTEFFHMYGEAQPMFYKIYSAFSTCLFGL